MDQGVYRTDPRFVLKHLFTASVLLESTPLVSPP